MPQQINITLLFLNSDISLVDFHYLEYFLGGYIVNFTKIEEGIVPIYENEAKERMINARELFYKLRGIDTKTKFSDWINERTKKYQFLENIDFIRFRFFTKGMKKVLETSLHWNII